MFHGAVGPSPSVSVRPLAQPLPSPSRAALQNPSMREPRATGRRRKKRNDGMGAGHGQRKAGQERRILVCELICFSVCGIMYVNFIVCLSAGYSCIHGFIHIWNHGNVNLFMENQIIHRIIHFSTNH